MKNKTDQFPNSILNSYGDLTYNVGSFGVFQTNVRSTRMFFSGLTEEKEEFKELQKNYKELSKKVNRYESLTAEDYGKLDKLAKFNEIRKVENQHQKTDLLLSTAVGVAAGVLAGVLTLALTGNPFLAAIWGVDAGLGTDIGVSNTGSKRIKTADTKTIYRERTIY